MKYEYCCKCDCATGKAGAGDDSLYTETDGPFCENCFPEFKSKQEQGEPVGKFAKFTDGIWREVTDGSAGVPLYTHPKEWVGLNNEQREDIWDEMVNTHGFAGDETEYMVELVINATEAKLKEKNV